MTKMINFKSVELLLVGNPNAGKSTLANIIIKDILGDNIGEMFATSSIEHETREVKQVEKLELKKNGKTLDFSLIDTPGIATKIDFEDFVKNQLSKYMGYQNEKISFVGSISWFFKPQLLKVMEHYHLNTGVIYRSPMEGLIQYHQKNNR